MTDPLSKEMLEICREFAVEELKQVVTPLFRRMHETTLALIAEHEGQPQSAVVVVNKAFWEQTFARIEALEAENAGLRDSLHQECAKNGRYQTALQRIETECKEAWELDES